MKGRPITAFEAQVAAILSEGSLTISSDQPAQRQAALHYAGVQQLIEKAADGGKFNCIYGIEYVMEPMVRRFFYNWLAALGYTITFTDVNKAGTSQQKTLTHISWALS